VREGLLAKSSSSLGAPARLIVHLIQASARAIALFAQECPGLTGLYRNGLACVEERGPVTVEPGLLRYFESTNPARRPTLRPLAWQPGFERVATPCTLAGPGHPGPAAPCSARRTPRSRDRKAGRRRAAAVSTSRGQAASPSWPGMVAPRGSELPHVARLGPGGPALTLAGSRGAGALDTSPHPRWLFFGGLFSFEYPGDARVLGAPWGTAVASPVSLPACPARSSA